MFIDVLGLSPKLSFVPMDVSPGVHRELWRPKLFAAFTTYPVFLQTATRSVIVVFAISLVLRIGSKRSDDQPATAFTDWHKDPWSDWWGLNPRSQRWQRSALPLSYSRSFTWLEQILERALVFHFSIHRRANNLVGSYLVDRGTVIRSVIHPQIGY
jgi:hypothetical protein